MIVPIKTTFRSLVLLVVTTLALLLAPAAADAGSYIVAQCSPGVYPGAPDAGFSATTAHYGQHVNCSPEAPGLEVVHSLNSGETGTVQGAYRLGLDSPRRHLHHWRLNL